ncbi:xylulokinase [Candidatus Hakubella thermalkaliphila]|uniref:Xylulose kinase n=3 Tax=Candidatus Hakubella thermalkaliphila TaxID=2754717 RepID=A0A6V8P7M5_9ACTN|nr:xylulokinase [Candidatus Hakubella thermalkaliphila]GFP27644.1 xylulokinase [Candidatus Hakubella thermalkaliphila]GFP42824.1 xylulokinase [Candidatus Hakubella thermalkaliphila]
MGYLLGIDLGTTSVKAILIDENGKTFGLGSEEYPLLIPRAGWAEQDPEKWWEVVKRVVGTVVGRSGVNGKAISGIGLSGQMHGLVLVDKNGNALRPCIVWADQRSAPQCRWLAERLGRQVLIQNLGNPTNTGFTAPKLLWVKQNENANYKKVCKILLPKDYIRFKLTGTFATDFTDASATLLFDVKRRQWSSQVLSILGVPGAFMPGIVESSQISGEVSKPAARELGISPGTPVIGGAGDQEASMVGNGVVVPGIALSAVGTGGQLTAATSDFVVDPQLRIHTLCHAVPESWHVMGAVQSAGLSLRWFRDNLAQPERLVGKLSKVDPYVLLSEEAKYIPPGSGGLLFLPYLVGERSPHMDPYARGAFIGLTIQHTKPHMVRALMEGVIFAMKDCLEIFRELGIEIKQVRVTGGGAKSSIWRQIQADIYGIEISATNVSEGSAFGAALLAGVGAGMFRDIHEACDATVSVLETVSPIREHVEIYEEMYDIYRSLYPALRDQFHRMSGYVRNEM